MERSLAPRRRSHSPRSTHPLSPTRISESPSPARGFAGASQRPLTPPRSASRAALRIDLSGKQPERCELLAQYIVVPANKTCHLQFNYPDPRIPSASGLTWRQPDPATGADLMPVSPQLSSPEAEQHTSHFARATPRWRAWSSNTAASRAHRASKAPSPARFGPGLRTVKAFTAAALTALLFAGILTLWVPDRWAVSLFQTGAFALAIAWALRFLIRPCRIETSATLIPLAATILSGRGSNWRWVKPCTARKPGPNS